MWIYALIGLAVVGLFIVIFMVDYKINELAKKGNKVYGVISRYLMWKFSCFIKI